MAVEAPRQSHLRAHPLPTWLEGLLSDFWLPLYVAVVVPEKSMCVEKGVLEATLKAPMPPKRWLPVIVGLEG